MTTTRRDIVRALWAIPAMASTPAMMFAGERNVLSSQQGVKPEDRPEKPDPELVLCIPGLWKDRTELLTAIAKKSDGYLFAGRDLVHTATKTSCELLFEDADARVTTAFSAAGPHWRRSDDMTAISRHKSVVYLVGRGGSQEHAESMMLAGRGLILAGGLGVKIESTGLAHSPRAWMKLTESLTSREMHEALVVYVTGEDVASCGMHNLGLRDAIAEGGDKDAAVELVRTFTRYLSVETPVIKDGQTFSMKAGAPIYRILDDPGVTYGAGSLFANPYGFWRLKFLRAA